MTYAKSYFHRGETVPLLGMTIPEHFQDVVGRHANREAVVSIPQNRRLSYEMLAMEVDRVARGLLAMGLGKGARIGIWSTNNVEWLLLQMASASVGAILVNINPAYRMRELAFALERSEVQAVFTIPAFRSSDYVAMLTELIPELAEDRTGPLRCHRFPMLKEVVLFRPEAPGAIERAASGFRLWREMIESGSEVNSTVVEDVAASLDTDDPINIQYTSGTTGFPKAVVLTHHNLLNNAWFSARAMHFTHEDRLCIPVPFYHCFGMVLSNLLCFSVGACAVIPCEYFDAGAILAAIDRERCTGLHGVPTMFIAELEHPEFASFRLDTLRTGIMAGAPCAPALMRRVIEDLHCPEILIGYGQTEASPLTHLTSRDDTFVRRTETVGCNLPHQEVKVVDPENGRIVPLRQVGEICFRGYHVMEGYYNDSDATIAAIDRHGWLHSGDLGRMDDEGYLEITGRLKDMIIRGGENIYPREIEDFIFTHPKVAEVAVFGVPDAFYGEEVAAWVRLHGGATASEDDIRAFCRGHMAHFKVPRHIRFVDAFPMTVTGKLQKFRMREMEIARSQEDSEPSERR